MQEFKISRYFRRGLGDRSEKAHGKQRSSPAVSWARWHAERRLRLPSWGTHGSSGPCSHLPSQGAGTPKLPASRPHTPPWLCPGLGLGQGSPPRVPRHKFPLRPRAGDEQPSGPGSKSCHRLHLPRPPRRAAGLPSRHLPHGGEGTRPRSPAGSLSAAVPAAQRGGAGGSQGRAAAVGGRPRGREAVAPAAARGGRTGHGREGRRHRHLPAAGAGRGG